MAIAASIYMTPPNILISDTLSGWGFLPVDGGGKFGKVEQINTSTTIVNVGNVIFYNVEDVASVIYGDTNVYKAINENKVIFIESANPTPP